MFVISVVHTLAESTTLSDAAPSAIVVYLIKKKVQSRGQRAIVQRNVETT